MTYFCRRDYCLVITDTKKNIRNLVIVINLCHHKYEKINNLFLPVQVSI